MKATCKLILPALLVTLIMTPALAGDDKIKGYVETVNSKEQTFEVDGMTLHVSEETRYDGLESFEDLSIGLRVKVKFHDEGDGYHASKIELKSIKGVMGGVNQEEQAFVVDGHTFHASEKTRYDDGLYDFGDLAEDQDVKVEFYIEDGRFYVTEVELDD